MQLRGRMLCAVAFVAVVLVPGSMGSASADAQPCADQPISAPHDPANPLGLSTPPGSNPLHGAQLFVNGPRHGQAAQAIESLLGLQNSSYADSDSWAAFKQQIAPQLAAVSPALAQHVRLLEKIGDQEETQNISEFAHGGGYDGIFAQMRKLLCTTLSADPGTVPVFSTFMIYPFGKYCPSLKTLLAWVPTFKSLVRAVAAAIGGDPAILLMEIDAVGTAGKCLQRHHALGLWEQLLGFEAQTLSALPHVVTYIEAGANDEGSASHSAQILADACVTGAQNICAHMRGIFVNATHFDWASSEISFGTAVSNALNQLITRRTGSPYVAHVVVNTAQNGRGPLLNPHPVTQGVESLCNPDGRGIGRLPTADTNPTFDGHSFPLLDAFLWTGVPGRSHNASCHVGDAAAGVFDPRFAATLAANANQQLGPGFPSLPY